MAPAKTKAVIVPQNREQAAKAVAEYGEIDRAISQLELLMNEEIAKLKALYFAKAQPLRIRAEAVSESVQAFCAANRIELTRGGKTKTVDFGVGKTSWRKNNAKVTVAGKEEDMVAFLRRHENPEMHRFVRETFELNRVAMLSNPNLAKSLPGVEISDDGETFEIKPDNAKIPDAVPTEAAA